MEREIKNIFKSRKKELETLRTSARMLFEDASKDLKNIFDLYSDKEKLDKFDNDTLISACKSNIKNVLNIIALNSDPLVDDQRLYDQLKLPKDKEIDNMEKSLIKRISSGDNKKSNSSSEKELMKFQLAVRSFFDSFSDSGRYKTSLTPIIFKPKKEAEKYKSIAAVFKEYFGSFFYKHRILSPTSDWCQCLYEELRAHGMKYECKYREIRKKIKANEARVNKRGNDILETSGAVSTFTEARGNLIKIFYNSLFRLKDFVSFKTGNISKLLNNLENIDRDQLFKELKKDS